MTTEVRVGIVGYGIMGKAHSYGYRVAPMLYDLPVRPVVAAISGRNATAVEAAARVRDPLVHDGLANTDRRSDDRHRRHLHSARNPRRDRDRGGSGRQGHPVREATRCDAMPTQCRLRMRLPRPVSSMLSASTIGGCRRLRSCNG